MLQPGENHSGDGRMSYFFFILQSVSFNRHIMFNTDPPMTDTFNYTTIYAPLGFFFMGVVSVLLLNKFIGKSKAKQHE